ncbi:NAD(P)-dependent oxidoreductase [Planctomycetota bacterium]
MPRIKILDTFAIPVPKYDMLKDQGTVSLFTDIPESDEITLRRAEGADVIVINKTKLTAAVIEQLEGVQLVAETASGYDNIDIKAAAAAGITVCNAPGYSTASVAELVFNLVQAMYRKLDACKAQVAQDGWLDEPLLGRELNGKTMGVVGFGKIGQATATIAKGYGMRCIVHTGNPAKYRDDFSDIEFVDLPAVFQQADIVSLHIPHNDATDKLVGTDLLAKLKPGSVLVNTARGGVVDEQALMHTLKDGLISACLDVLTVEPMQAGHPLKDFNNVIISPHVGWYTDEAVDRLMQITHDNIAKFYARSPQNVVAM